ncbi:Cytochrome P450 2C29 [Araneus ventricosus]|nr:Cytochrome P450 2C29 [Araneus ventricosus]
MPVKKISVSHIDSTRYVLTPKQRSTPVVIEQLRREAIHKRKKFCRLQFEKLLDSSYSGILKWYKSRQKRPPGPVGLPFVGYLPFLGKEPHKTFWNMRKKYGDIISVYLGPKYTIVLNEYKVAKEVLSHPGSLDRAPDLFKHLDDVGFVVENGARWVEQRRFTMSTAKGLGLGKDYWGTLIMEELFNLIQKLQKLKGKPFDISEDLLSSLNTNILSLLIGRRLGKDEVDKIHLSAEFADAAMTKMGPSNPASLVPGLRKTFEIFKIAGYDKARKTVLQFSSFLK